MDRKPASIDTQSTSASAPRMRRVRETARASGHVAEPPLDLVAFVKALARDMARADAAADARGRSHPDDAKLFKGKSE